jgi:hypothetical protein
MQYRDAGLAVKTGSNHIIVGTYPYNIRVRVIGIDNRIFIGAVGVIGYPYLGFGGYSCAKKAGKK